MSEYRIKKLENNKYLVQRRVLFWWISEDARDKPLPKDHTPRPKIDPSYIDTYAKKIPAQFQTAEEAVAWTYYWAGRYVKKYKPEYTYLTPYTTTAKEHKPNTPVSAPLKESKTKGNMKPRNQTGGRKAPPPPPPTRRIR